MEIRKTKCDSCKNSNMGIQCKVKSLFRERPNGQSEFIKIMGGGLMECPFYEQVVIDGKR